MSDLSDESDDDVYEVEKITNHVVCDGETYYCVSWKGYEGPEAQTWEPKENLLSCEDLLNAYIASTKEEKDLDSSIKTFKKIDSSDDSSDSGLATLQKLQSFQESTEKDFQKNQNRGRSRNRGRGRGRAKPRTSKPKRVTSGAVTSSSSNQSSSDESPQIKDPFWANLEKGQVSVFTEDLYSKVKRRRGPPTEELGAETTLLPAITSLKKRCSKKKVHVDKNETQKNEPDVENKKNSLRKSPVSFPSGDENGNNSMSSPVLKYLDDQLNEKKSKAKRGRKPNNKKLQADKIAESISNENDDLSLSIADEKKEEAVPSQQTAFDKEIEKKLSKCEAQNAEKLSKTETILSVEESPNVEDLTEDKPLKDSNVLDSPIQKKTSSDKKATVLDEVRTFSNALQKIDDDLMSKKDQTKKKKVAKKNADKTRSPLSGNKNKSNSVLQTSKPIGAKEKWIKEKTVVSKTLPKDGHVKDSPKPLPKPMRSDELKRSLSQENIQSKDQSSLVSSEKPEKKTKLKSSIGNGSKPVLKTHTQSQAAPNFAPLSPSLSRSDDGISVFEAMQKEFESPSFPPTKFRNTLEDKEERISEEVVNDNVDMSEYLKVKVNFSLDEISLKEIEQHHETGEPPCRLGREISNAEFRQFIRTNNYEMVFEVLKSKGRMYNLEHQDAMWMTQLMIASAAGSSEIVKVLAHHGAKVNARTKSNQTALMFAAEKGHDITVRTLLMYGAYLNLQTSSGETALMKAAKGGHLSIVHNLLQAGADPCIKSPHGVSALNLEGRTATAAVSLVKKHKQNVETAVETCIRQTLQHIGIKPIGSSLFGVKTYNVREHALVYFTYHCSLKDLPASQGIALFAVHGSIGPGLSVKCRMRGPCHVNAVTVNNAVMKPIMPSKETDKYSHFMTNIVWRTGQNSFRMFLAQDGLSREKLYLCAFVVGLL